MLKSYRAQLKATFLCQSPIVYLKRVTGRQKRRAEDVVHRREDPALYKDAAQQCQRRWSGVKGPTGTWVLTPRVGPTLPNCAALTQHEVNQL
jgi:hypothetical protein